MKVSVKRWSFWTSFFLLKICMFDLFSKNYFFGNLFVYCWCVFIINCYFECVYRIWCHFLYMWTYFINFWHIYIFGIIDYLYTKLFYFDWIRLIKDILITFVGSAQSLALSHSQNSCVEILWQSLEQQSAQSAKIANLCWGGSGACAEEAPMLIPVCSGASAPPRRSPRAHYSILTTS